MDLETIRNNIRASISNYLTLPCPPLYNLHLNEFAGAGKTTITLEELSKFDSYFIYLGQKHNIVEEQIKKSPFANKFEYPHIKSRIKTCLNEEYKKLAINYNIDIKYLCRQCKYFNNCEYYINYRNLLQFALSWFGVHSHLDGLVYNYIVEHNNLVDIVVIDEFFLNSLYKHYHIDYKTITKTANVIYKLNDSDEKIFIINLLIGFSNGIKNGLNYNNLSTLIIDYITKKYNLKNINNFLEEFNLSLFDYYEKYNRLFYNYIDPIFNLIRYLKYYHNQYKINKTINHISDIIRIFNNKINYIDISYYNLECLDLPSKILILDATTPTSFYNQIFKRTVKSTSNMIDIYGSVIYQITSGKYVMQTLDNSKSAKDKLLYILNLITRKHKKKVLVICRKKYEQDIKSLKNKLLVVDHYPISGTNLYNTFDIVVIFGSPEPRPDELNRMSNLLNVDPNIILYLLRETNIIQGIHRIRFTIKENPTFIYILTNLDLPISNINRISLNDLISLLETEIKEKIIFEYIYDDISNEIIDLLENNNKLYELNKIYNLKFNKTFIRFAINKMKNDKIISISNKNKIKYLKLLI